MKTFEMKTVIHFGDNALDRLAELPYKKVLVITDPFIAKGKMIELITDPLRRGGKEFEVFSDVVPDAPVGKIAEGVKKFLEYQPEVVVAVCPEDQQLWQSRSYCNSYYQWYRI